MEVSMDALRKRLIADYNSLVRKLNDNIKDKAWDPEINIQPNEIQREMDGIRDAIVTLSFSYIEGEDGFGSLDDDTHFEEFNPE